MSMLKKTAALTVSAVLLLQPMTASAVTWNNIVNGLRNSGSNRYTEDGTTIEQDGDNYTVSGGTIDDYGRIDEENFGKNANVFLNDMVMNDGLGIGSENGNTIHVRIGEGMLIKRGVYAEANGAGSGLNIINNGKVYRADIHSEDGGHAYMINNGDSHLITGEAKGNGSATEIENAQNATTYDIKLIGYGQGSAVRAVNNGNVERCVTIGSPFGFESQNGGYTVEFINNGSIESDWIDTWLNDATINVTDDKMESVLLTVNVEKGTSAEEIIRQLGAMADAKDIAVYELEQYEYGGWKVVNEYFLKDGSEDPDEPENPDDPENPEQPETPEQPEATQQPAFEVSKYDQERHEMEEKRKEEAIGGVYGSPYWVKQLYLGYHSLNLRLFVGEQQSNFKQSLSWMPDSTKQLTLRVNTDAPEKLTMRLDEKALETLERTEFSVITLLDKSGNAVMQYSLTDLRSVYDQYGLSGDDQMVVGGANDDVMKIVNGEMKPIEE